MLLSTVKLRGLITFLLQYSVLLGLYVTKREMSFMVPTLQNIMFVTLSMVRKEVLQIESLNGKQRLLLEFPSS